MTSRRRPPAPPPSRGPLFAAVCAVLTIAVPGVGHIYAQLLTRGFIWLAGNLLVMLILVQGERGTPGVLLALGALRVAALADLFILHKGLFSGGSEGGAGADR